MTKVTLVVLAAGLGSRFGGIKQLEPINSNGNTIVDFSLFDAIKAGFSKVVFVVRKEIIADFRKSFSTKLDCKIETKYVCQEINDIPGEFLPTKRNKPWGTAHALLTAKQVVEENFCVINADDFYGRGSFTKIFEVLSNVDRSSTEFAMIGYRLKNTLSRNGSVSRGECFIGKDRYLEKIVERKTITMVDDRIFDLADSQEIELNSNGIVSMNFWGFTPQIFPELESSLTGFLSKIDDHLGAEFLIPDVVDAVISGKRGSVRVFDTDSEWMGITYKEDKVDLEKGIELFEAKGVYPKDLWK